MKNERLVFAAKCAFAFVSIFGLIFYAMHNTGPSINALEFFILTVGGLAMLGVFVYFYISIAMAFKQWMLNHGATDTDWLWFNSDPKGLENLRKKASENEATHSPSPQSKTPHPQ